MARILGLLQGKGAFQRRLGGGYVALGQLQLADLVPAPGEIGCQVGAALLGLKRFRPPAHGCEGAAVDVVAVGEIGAPLHRPGAQGQGLAQIPKLQTGLARQIAEMRLHRAAPLQPRQLLQHDLLEFLPISLLLQQTAEGAQQPFISGQSPKPFQQGLLLHCTVR